MRTAKDEMETMAAVEVSKTSILGDLSILNRNLSEVREMLIKVIGHEGDQSVAGDPKELPLLDEIEAAVRHEMYQAKMIHKQLLKIVGRL